MTRNDPADEGWLTAEIEHLASSRKYKDLAPETIADIVRREVRPGKPPKAIIAAARERLHKVAAFYLGLPKFPKATAALDAAFLQAEDAAIEEACLLVLRSHSSTRERLPQMRAIFEHLLALTGPVSRLIDIACAVQPLGWRWMGLSRETEYIAVDINQRFTDLIERYFSLENVPHQVLRQDALVRPIELSADLALLWKMYHCLEQRCEGAGWKVVEETSSRFIAISFPLLSLAGKKMGFHEKHAPTLQREADQRGWKIHRFSEAGELFLVLEKPEIPTPKIAAAP